MSWTDERVELLRELWGAGLTASQIAYELGGVTRHAVIGKANRLGLEGRPSPIRAASGNSDRTQRRIANERRKRAERILNTPVVRFSAPVYEVVEPAAPVAMEDRDETGCQWIEGDPTHDDSCKCGAQRQLGKPYCPDHQQRAFIRKPKKDAA